MKTLSVLIFLILLSGCSAPLITGKLDDGSGNKLPKASEMDPFGAIPAPQIPADLKPEKVAPSEDTPAPYSPQCLSPDDQEICQLFEASSRLFLKVGEVPQSPMSLEQRLNASLDEGREVLQSLGYYEGQVSGNLIAAEHKGKTKVTINFQAGPRYKMAHSPIKASDHFTPDNRVAAALPQSLANLSLPENAPARAEDVLRAVDQIIPIFNNNGYPAAEIKAANYYLLPETKKLEAEIIMTPGPFTLMGELQLAGEISVTRNYLEGKKTWTPGDIWSQQKVDAYLERLRQSGLFKTIEITPKEGQNEAGQKDLILTLAPGLEKSTGLSLQYDSDFGMGGEFFWEHRNLTGRGDKFRLEAPLWTDLQEVYVNYLQPYFWGFDYDLVASGGFINQDTDAYKLAGASFALGLQRTFSRNFYANLKGSAEGGYIRDPGEPKSSYTMWGLPLELSYSSAKNILDAKSGVTIMANLAPYNGKYEEPFTIFRSRLEGRLFLPLIGEDKLILALRGVWGTVAGVDSAQDIPPSVRFYAGGGGSVRGYAYQSLGPENDDGDPLGGLSVIESSIEARYRHNENWGLVAFLDGGAVYGEPDSLPGQNMLWGAGLGGRYYTPIGPVRFDVAVPINPRPDDASFQVYISIGQSF